jgi:LmbE family N-acetylglucosaminyl deacetylase
MIIENQIVPYHCSELPAGPWLVFAPHADDETFGMGGTLLKAKAAGLSVKLVIMTDGALGGSQAELVAVRRAEAHKVASYLGIGDVKFLEQPDRGLHFSDTLCNQISAIITASAASTVFFPGVYEPHPDHRSTAMLVWEALNRMDVPEPQAVAYEISVQNPVNSLVDVTAEMPGKKAAMELYLSQLAENNYSEIVQAQNKLRTFSLPVQVAYAEGFYHFSREERAGSLFAAMHARLQALLAQ